ncbi:DUF2637 domain-containing protein [Streptomyces sp. NPDC048297]|uniref:DUF2637 domain-containing protein n=1 Tax=Streptomyces sp. NPDC048297 TaxID=3365531 RepID=UPI003711E20D
MDRNSYEAHPYDYEPQHVFRGEHDTLSQPTFDAVSFPTQQSWHAPAPEVSPWDLDEELAHMLSGATRAAAAPAPAPTPGPASPERSHRKVNRRRLQAESHLLDGGQRVTHVTVLIGTIVVAAASLLTWAISYSYGQLHTIAESVLPSNLAEWWPLTVYGPWFVAALSILRATVQRRTARRSWGVILSASAVAVALCVSHASQSILTFVMLGIPPITALVCFWELVGQVSSKYRSTKQGAHAQRNSKR